MDVEIEHTFTLSLKSYDIDVTAGVSGEFEPGTNSGDDCDYVRCGRVVIFDVDATLAALASVPDTGDEYRDGVYYNNGTTIFTRAEFVAAAEKKFEAMLGELMEAEYEAAAERYDD
ncbi:MAG: hypothetical protein EBR82_27425 [Caulobacteraceae bacterium]|nr:hypothetical protein [Caulobacteraceae bacterium]